MNIHNILKQTSQRADLTVKELVTLSYIHYVSNNTQFPQDIIDSLKEARALTSTEELKLTPEALELFYDTPKSLGAEIKAIFPSGKKPGTPYYWCDAAAIIDKRITDFKKKYGDFSDDEILRATERYVQSFMGNYAYMKLAKYFIFKNEVKAGEVEPTSDLLTFLENKEEIGYDPNWGDDLI